MEIKSERFGSLEVDDGDAISFPDGLVGFAEEKSFVLLRHREGSPIGWLQSVSSAAVAFPVVSLDALHLEHDYPLPHDDAAPYATMAVLSAAPGKPATVNLLAPIVVNVTTRVGAQVFIESTKFSTIDRFALRQAAEPLPSSAEQPPANQPSPSPYPQASPGP
ncbi:MAG TPA: flagellar assembly protein FliW [Polyangiaceae bacterium]|nr:flagellar assembly protein FliW [Polyangiaceae bacterium]